MNHKQMSVWMYTHTHTHTHTHTKPCCLRLLCQRCLQWVNAFWQGIRKLANKHKLGAGRIRVTEQRPGKSVWASHPNGCWYSRTDFLRSAAEFLVGLRCLTAQSSRVWWLLKSSVAALRYIRTRLHYRQTTLTTCTITTFTATNNSYIEGLVA